jgi:DNA-directed RNA polymerase subunit M/transcription elongation factor TFIIS
MGCHNYKELSRHVGHDVECVQYANNANVAIECNNCNEVIMDFDNPSVKDIKLTCPKCKNDIEYVQIVHIRSLVYEKIGPDGDPIEYPEIAEELVKHHRCPECDHETKEFEDFLSQ